MQVTNAWVNKKIIYHDPQTASVGWCHGFWIMVYAEEIETHPLYFCPTLYRKTPFKWKQEYIHLCMQIFFLKAQSKLIYTLLANTVPFVMMFVMISVTWTTLYTDFQDFVTYQNLSYYLRMKFHIFSSKLILIGQYIQTHIFIFADPLKIWWIILVPPNGILLLSSLFLLEAHGIITSDLKFVQFILSLFICLKTLFW